MWVIPVQNRHCSYSSADCGELALEEPEMKFLLSTAAIATLTFVPAAAYAQFAGLDNNTVFAGAVGAGLGGVVGSQLAGSNNRTEGAAIGALAGGLAGAAYGNSQSTYYGNPYAGQFNPGFNGRTLAGTAIGAGLGGAIGSNLAGSGQRQEGTAIGAVLGGVAGYALANGRSNSRYSSGPVGTYGAPAIYGGGYGAPVGFSGYSGPVGYGGGFATPAPLPSMPVAPGPQYVPGGMVAGPIIPVTSYGQNVEQTIIRQRTIQAPPRVLPGRVIHHAPVVVTQPCPSGTTEQSDGTCMSAPRTVYEPAPTVIPSYCPSGTTDMGNGTCKEPARTVIGSAPIVIPQSCPAGTTDLGNGTCQEPARTVIGAAPIVIPQSCPAGTTDLGNGTCQEPARTIIGSAPIVVNQPCPSGTTDLGNGTCEAPARIVEADPVYIPAPAPVPACPAGSYLSEGTCLVEYEGGHSIPDTIVTGAEYCYGDGKAMYDSSGRKIKGKTHDGMNCQGHH